MGAAGPAGMGSRSIRTIKGSDYLYYEYYDEKKRIARYCGPASKASSRRRALEFELEHLRKQVKKYSLLAEMTERRLARMKRA